MDTTDFDLILGLLRDPFASYASLGGAAGISGTAAKARIDGLRRRGTLRRLFAVVAPATFGRLERQVIFTNVPADLDLAPVLAIRDVLWAGRGHQGPVAVNLAVRSPDDLPIDDLRRVFGAPPVAVVAPDAEPPPREVLSPLDWRVLDALIDDPRATVRDLAAKAGLSERTTKARRDALIASAAAWVAPEIDATREPGLILYTAYLGFAGRDDAKRIPSKLLVRLRMHDDPPGAFYWGAAGTLAEMHTIEAGLRATLGVVGVTINVPKEVVVATDRMHAWIAEELAAWARARPRGRRLG